MLRLTHSWTMALPSWRAFVALALPNLLALSCVHGPKGDTTAASAESLPPSSGYDDPDPEADAKAGGPQFCNPTGKQGEDLKKCYALNDAIYRQFELEAKQREPWFNFPSDSWVNSEELDSHLVHLVTAQEAAAVKRLETVPLVELSAADVQAFTGKPTTAPAGTKPYLTRGLAFVNGTGSFSVFTKDQAIFVRYDATGMSAPAEKRTALVVYLKFVPKSVYVDCQVAE